MKRHETFAEIPLKFKYSSYKQHIARKSDELIKGDNTRTAVDASEGVLSWFYEDELEENGMGRLAVIISAFMYQLVHNEINPLMAYAVNWHIEDFENGNYEELFKEEDLKLLKEDIAIVKEYLSKHPEALEE